MHVVLSSVGRQHDLVRRFSVAVGSKGYVTAIDVDRTAVAREAADGFLASPAFDSDSYPGFVLEVCLRGRPGLWVSLNERELVVLEDLRSDMSSLGCVLVGASRKVIDLCQDKYRLAAQLRSWGLSTPDTVLFRPELADRELPFPLFAKPRYGRGSAGNRLVDSSTSLLALSRDEATEYILQPFLTGPEYGLDVVNDLGRQNRGVLARLKQSMRNGETDVVTTVDADRFRDIGMILGERLNHQGCADVDVIELDGEYLILDINLRFGGGHIFSAAAGADLPGAMVAWAEGLPEPPGSLQYSAGVVLARASSAIVLQ